MKGLGIFLLVISVILSSFAWCSDSSSILIGKWVQTNNPKNQVEILSDKTVLLVEKSGSAAGKWSILNDGRIMVEITILGTKTVLFCSINDGILTLKGSGVTNTYKKLK
ncbi:MAG: hypothetical protein ACYDIC_04020 [Desulfobaccales bacterium]